MGVRKDHMTHIQTMYTGWHLKCVATLPSEMTVF